MLTTGGRTLVGIWIRTTANFIFANKGKGHGGAAVISSPAAVLHEPHRPGFLSSALEHLLDAVPESIDDSVGFCALGYSTRQTHPNRGFSVPGEVATELAVRVDAAPQESGVADSSRALAIQTARGRSGCHAATIPGDAAHGFFVAVGWWREEEIIYLKYLVKL